MIIFHGFRAVVSAGGRWSLLWNLGDGSSLLDRQLLYEGPVYSRAHRSELWVMLLEGVCQVGWLL